MSVRRNPAAVAVAAAILFLLLACWELSGDSLPFDLSIRNAVHTWASPMATGLLLGAAWMGSGWVMLPLGALVAWRLTLAHPVREAILFGAACLSANALSELLKLAFHRHRPRIFFGLPPAFSYSFPSGHAFVGTVFYGLLAAVLVGSFPAYRRLIGAMTIVLVLAIGLSRVYLGYHYPSDVLGGWMCAAAWLSMARWYWLAKR
ncbi:MAG TPA: phosphatase PAP2 family protein [Bryobacteraceae bacterium]|nr:phosphatase PAP2 family protein [Bryobacteraceae bacterium]